MAYHRGDRGAGALAPGYRYAQFGRAHIAPLIASLKAWYPSMAAGVNSCYLREDFYLKRVGLDGDLDRDVIGIRIVHGVEMVGFWSFERAVDSLAIWGRLLVVAPEHRGAKVSIHALAGAEGIGRVMGPPSCMPSRRSTPPTSSTASSAPATGCWASSRDATARRWRRASSSVCTRPCTRGYWCPRIRCTGQIQGR